MSVATSEFGENILNLATIEVSESLSDKLITLGRIQKELKEVQERQAKMDFLHLASCVEEWCRIVASIKVKKMNGIWF